MTTKTKTVSAERQAQLLNALLFIRAYKGIEEGEGGLRDMGDGNWKCGTGLRHPDAPLHGMNKTQRAKLLRELMEWGVIDQRENGEYFATEKGKEVASQEQMILVKVVTNHNNGYGWKTYTSRKIVNYEDFYKMQQFRNMAGSNNQTSYAKMFDYAGKYENFKAEKEAQKQAEKDAELARKQAEKDAIAKEGEEIRDFKAESHLDLAKNIIRSIHFSIKDKNTLSDVMIATLLGIQGSLTEEERKEFIQYSVAFLKEGE